jgi:hypothetical protein
MFLQDADNTDGMQTPAAGGDDMAPAAPSTDDAATEESM